MTISEDHEEWKDIPGYEGIYQISDMGRIKSMTRGNRKEKILKSSPNTYGYLKCTLSKDNKQKDGIIHRLVGELFIENPENKLQINHKFGNKKDNRKAMLEWNTPQENTIHAYATGLTIPRKGQDVHSSKLTDADVLKIRELRKSGVKLAEISKMFKVVDSCISSISNGKNWKHI